jgi:hypothetical protein
MKRVTTGHSDKRLGITPSLPLALQLHCIGGPTLQRHVPTDGTLHHHRLARIGTLKEVLAPLHHEIRFCKAVFVLLAARRAFSGKDRGHDSLSEATVTLTLRQPYFGQKYLALI